MGISGNERADTASKEATKSQTITQTELQQAECTVNLKSQIEKNGKTNGIEKEVVN